MTIRFGPARPLRLRASHRLLISALSVGSAALLLAGCGQSTTYPAHGVERDLIVHGMLFGNRQEQEISVEYTRLMNDGFFRGITPASGADVIVTGTEAHRFAEDPERPGIYRASFAPRAGERYTLRIRGPRGEQVAAETRVPGAPQLGVPSRDTSVQRYQDVSLYWARAPAAHRYIGLKSASRYPNSLQMFFSPKHDTTATVQLGLMLEEQVRIAIAAVDSNYSEYIQSRVGDAGPSYRFRSTVQGGWGLFGSAAVSEPRLITFEK